MMKIRAMLLALAFVLAATPAPAAGIRVHGKVEAGRQAIAGATVRLAALPADGQAFAMYWSPFVLAESARTRSGADGRFELVAPAPGLYQLQVTADGFLGSSTWREVYFGDELAIEDPVVLVPARQVRLAVVDPQDRPVAAARVRLWLEKIRAYDPWPFFAETAADGAVVLQVPQAMDAAAIVWAAGHAATRVELPSDQEQVALKLDPGTPVEVEVVDAQRRPQGEVMVLVRPLEMAIGATGSDGKAVVRIGKDHQEIAFLAHRGRRALAPLPPPGPDGEVRLRVELPPAKPVTGQVVALPGGAPVAGAWVASWEWPPVFARSDRRGQFELFARASRHLELRAVQQGYRPASAQVGESVVPTILGLDPVATVEGRVRDADGNDLAGVWVRAEVEGESLHDTDRAAFAQTGEKGRFLIEDAVAGQALGVFAIVVGAQGPELQSPKVKVGPLAAGERARVELQLPPPAEWSCLIVDPAGEPIAGAEVFAAPAAEEKYRRLELEHLADWENELSYAQYLGVRRLGSSDAEGRLGIGGLNAGSYDIAVRAAGFAPLLRRKIRFGPPAEEESGGGLDQIVLQPVAEARGKVVDEHGEGIVGARLHLDLAEHDPLGRHRRPLDELPPVATSGKDGEFRFAAVDAAQRFDLLAAKEGFVTARLADITLAEAAAAEEAAGGGEPDGSPSLTLTLIRGFRIEGRVTSKGEPLRSVGIGLDPVDRELGRVDHYYEHTDEQGRYLIDGIRPGRYRLEAGRLDGYQNWKSEAFEARGGDKKAIDVELDKAAAIAGRVLRPNGTPVADARVFLEESREEETWSNSSDVTDELGSYRIETAKPGPGWLRVKIRSHKTHWRQVEVAAGVNEIDIVLEEGAIELSGRVVDRNGVPVAGAEVQLFGELMREARSGADGEVRFADLEAGNYGLKIEAKGYYFSPQLLQLGQSLSGQIWRLAAAEGRIRGQVFGLEPAQLGGVMVRVRPAADGEEGPAAAYLGGSMSLMTDEESPYEKRVDPQGRFSIDGISAGRWVLVADHLQSKRALIQEVEIGEVSAEREQNFDFRRVGGPWVGNFRLAGESAPDLMYFLIHPSAGFLLTGQNIGGRLELRAEPGSYMLMVIASDQAMKMLEIEIGAGASEATFDLESPPQ